MRITTVQLWRPRVSCAVLCPPAASNDCGSVLAVSVSEAVDSPVSEQGAGKPGTSRGRDSTPRSGGRPPPSLTTVTASSPSLPRSGQFRSRRRPPSSPRPVLFRSGGLVAATGRRKEWVMLSVMLPAPGMLLVMVMPPEIIQENNLQATAG